MERRPPFTPEMQYPLFTAFKYTPRAIIEELFLSYYLPTVHELLHSNLFDQSEYHYLSAALFIMQCQGQNDCLLQSKHCLIYRSICTEELMRPLCDISRTSLVFRAVPRRQENHYLLLKNPSWSLVLHHSPETLKIYSRNNLQE